MSSRQTKASLVSFSLLMWTFTIHKEIVLLSPSVLIFEDIMNQTCESEKKLICVSFQ